ncbi:C4-dicarboxylate transport sensor protein DctB [Janthinobacterium sp. HH103]|uniref:sensor histidine kinase n=1 Tax=unclassified Janthinobacterium TaxID=2610881 RepID=UPI0008749D55|nr:MULTISPECIES: ATP-binding protein [unclassified Janthinobacterium]OEZ66622.1 C4-dicarboxylate transport sensor protein DctB [Janthinobacterium sp. HH103]OEZ69568.1 C4-dicarboxylate transport sensor protein DctB [Janthinobacterium sp. HH100]QOU72612.1 C4-dicarboxylate transport sensor protein DctB [Janthinobacterium sp. HH102]
MAFGKWTLRPALGPLLAVGSLVVLTWVSYAWVKQRQLDELHRTLDSRAELYAASIGGALNKYEFLPLAVAQSDAVAQLLEQPSADKVTQINAYLVDMNRRAGAFAVYVLDDKGTTLASSNWQDRSSYVGVNYGFRPYFKNAIAGGIGRFYGIGFSTFEAGYFISQPVQRNGRILGIVAAKVNLDWIEQSWRTPGAGEQIWVKDANGVIILATTPAFKFKTLAPLSPAAKKDISEQRQFLQENLPILPHKVQRQFADGASVMTLERPQTSDSPALSGSADKADYLAVNRVLGPLQWQITVLAELDQVNEAARNAAIAAALGWALLLLALMYARQRRRRIADKLNAQQTLARAYEQLEIKVEQRTADLVHANGRLQAEVAERERAEQTLRYAQAELVQSGKLAAIGQMAAGVTHELNQPLAALQTFSDNAKVFLARGQIDDALDNLSTISDLVKRLGYVTSQLKGFARRSDDARKPVSVRQAFAQTMLQIRTRKGSQRLTLHESWLEDDIIVLCNAIGLEQVFTNLITNAMDAVPEGEPVQIWFQVRREGSLAVLHITDNGPGIPLASLDKIFDPFYTTKEHGLGLGLSISAGILRAAGSALAVRNRSAQEGGGAQFTITLSCAPGENKIETKE